MLKGENKRDRDGGRERMEVDVDALNHWWRSSRIHYGLSWKRDNARGRCHGRSCKMRGSSCKVLRYKTLLRDLHPYNQLSLHQHPHSPGEEAGRGSHLGSRVHRYVHVCMCAVCVRLTGTVMLMASYKACSVTGGRNKVEILGQRDYVRKVGNSCLGFSVSTCETTTWKVMTVNSLYSTTPFALIRNTHTHTFWRKSSFPASLNHITSQGEETFDVWHITQIEHSAIAAVQPSSLK